jgi:cyclopropane-fatty-acyl-phospholipid synthase
VSGVTALFDDDQKKQPSSWILSHPAERRDALPAGKAISAPRDTDAYSLALMSRRFPGFLDGQEQITRSAGPYFRLVSSISGGLDHIETIHQWRERFAAPSPERRSAAGRLAFTSGVSANSVCFERELLDHYRLVFQNDG